MKYNDTTFRIVRAWLLGAGLSYTAQDVAGTIVIRTRHTVITCSTVAYIKVSAYGPNFNRCTWGKTQWDVVNILEDWRDRGVKL